MSLENLEAFKRKAEEIMSKEEADKLTCRVEELSCDRENIALYTKLTNEEMVFNTRLANAEEAAEERGKERGIELGKELGVELGKELGKEQGSKETKIDIAKNLIKAGLDSNKISEFTGLTVEEIEALRKVK